LFANKKWSGAYYLAGYAVECALKACICKLTKVDEFPDRKFAERCWSHDLEELLKLCGLEPDFEKDRLVDASLEKNWDIVTEWNERSHYSLKTKDDAEEKIEAITDKKHGVLSWLKLRY